MRTLATVKRKKQRMKNTQKGKKERPKMIISTSCSISVRWTSPPLTRQTSKRETR